jgi:multidrug efflux pump subunit AcrB
LIDLARQVRQAFYGEEAQRIQRARDDVRVMVRYPEWERRSIGDLENMRIRTPAGVEVPFSQVAVVTPGRGYATIARVDRQRAVNVTAAVDTDVVSAGTVLADLEARVMPELLEAHPNVRYSFEGMQSEQRDAMGGLQSGFLLALFMIFALLAVPLKSYVQPLIIMSAIPFGLVGALWGHMLLGYTLTMMSAFGMIALAGVVVNDSLVLVHFINQRRAGSVDLATAVREAGGARFRPILLTSLTTFAGLSPLLLETSMQAKFLIPMAVSLAFGVMFATFVTLLLVPVGYVILEDLRMLPSSLRRLLGGSGPDAAPASGLQG